MADDVGREKTTKEKKLTPYQKMPRELKEMWRERLFNTLKLTNSLLDADSVITYAFWLWTKFTMLVVIMLVINPARFSWRFDFCFSLGAFLIYYALIGFVRRQTQRNLVALSAQHPHPTRCMSGKLFKGRRPYNEDNDPPIARRGFRLRPYLGIPRRGFAQKEVIIWQFVLALCYIGYYAWYVLWKGQDANDGALALLWMLQVTMTGGGILVLFKNAGFLVDTNRLLKTIEGFAVSILGHAHATVNVEKNGKKSCDDQDECKDKK